MFTVGSCPFRDYISTSKVTEFVQGNYEVTSCKLRIAAEAREQASKKITAGSSKLKKNWKSACEDLTCE
jgi:hypothetical protein